jgi:hypothetical protein
MAKGSSPRRRVRASTGEVSPPPCAPSEETEKRTLDEDPREEDTFYSHLERLASVLHHIQYVISSGSSGQTEDREYTSKDHLARARDLLNRVLEDWGE